jgi:flagellar hook-associated protein 1
MVTINSTLYIGSSALMAQQLAISVTGQNIANVNTTGYSRQRVNMVNTAVPSNLGPVGTGVKTTGISRIYDQFLNASINDDIQQKGTWEAKSQTLTQIESIFTETTDDGLSQNLSKFWNAWQDLSNNPSGYAERKAVADQGQALAQNLQDDYNSLDRIQTDMDDRITAAVVDVNTMATQISNLNDNIANIERLGQPANDLRDQRDLLLNQLAEKINFTSSEDSDGRVTVTLGNNKKLVGNPPDGKLSTVVNTSNHNYHDLVWTDTFGTTTTINSSITAGNLNGYLNVRDSLVSGYKDSLNKLAVQIITEVNSQHAKGTDLEGSSGVDFFKGTSAATIQLNSDPGEDILNNLNLIAAAAAGTVSPEPVSGDNTNALAISQLQTEKWTIDGNTVTFDTYYNSLVSSVGTDSRNASTNLTQQTNIVDQTNNLRDSISGVSTDEEMTNLIQFQHGYAAAAKLIDTVSQMMDTVINMVR